MKNNKMVRLVTVFAIALFALGLFPNTVHAFTFPRSSKVAMVPSNFSSNGGSLYTGLTWPDGLGFTFTNVAVASIANGAATDPIAAGGYDTVVLMLMSFNFATNWADADFSSRILSFVNGGGKLIMYTSESSVASFGTFVYPFTVDTPGQTGTSGGTLVNIADDTLSSSNTLDASYINLGKIVSQTDAVGDCNVMTSVDSHWYIDMTGINVHHVGGPAHTYAFYGAGLMIFNGLDIDNANAAPSNANGGAALGMVWWRELCGQVLGPGQSVSGLTLTPPTATNVLGAQHTVTALVKDTINNPVPSVVVTFTILSGPNAGLTGQATTDANGEATFSWSSQVVGTDTVQASALNAAGAPVTTTATKDWVTIPNVVPEVPFGTMAAIATICVGFAFFAVKGKIRKILF